MSTLELIRDGTSLDISDEDSFVHEENSGFGMPPIIRYTEKGPQQWGVSDRGYTIQPRFVQLVIPILAADWTEQFALRTQLINALKPCTDPLILKFTLPGGDVRQLDCHTENGPSFSTREQIAGSASIRAGFTLIAPDPTWYDPVAEAESFQISAGSDTWPVPFAVPWTVGASTIDISRSIAYAGSAPSYPVIRITGPLQNAVITNNTLDLKLDFTGTTIAGADYYDIDLRYGRKTVTDATGVNRIANLTSDSDLATFRLEVDPEAPGGVNSIRVQGIAATASTKVEITYFVRYIGI